MFELQPNGSFTIVRLAHGKVQAMDLEFCRAVAGLFEELANGPECKAVVLTGSGRVFSAGVDLKRLVAEPPSYVDVFLPALRHLFRTLWEFPAPLVAAINGAALAGGCVAASAADWRVLSRDAPIGMPESRVGLPLPAEGIEIMRFVTAAGVLPRVIGRGEQWTNEEARSAGLADELAAPESLIGRAAEHARRMAETDPEIFRTGKLQLRMPASLAMREHHSRFGQQVQELWKSERVRSTVRRFIAERLGGDS